MIVPRIALDVVTSNAVQLLDRDGKAARDYARESLSPATRRANLERVLGDLDVGPHEAIHVGDSLKADVGGASALGIRTVWVTRRVKDPAKALADHPGPKPDHQIADLAEVVEFLDAT